MLALLHFVPAKQTKIDPEAQRWGGLGWVGREGEQKEEKGLTSQTKTPEPYFQSSVENTITTSRKLWVYMWG